MAGKPWIVAILAAMVVAMIGVVFLQKSPEGFVLSGSLRIAENEQERLETQLRQEAATDLAGQQEKPVDPASLSVVKKSNQGEVEGLDVSLQAQGKPAPAAIDYLNALMERYTRREGRVEEIAKNKLEIAESERKLAAVVKQRESVTGQIEGAEKELKQVLRRELIEESKLAKQDSEARLSPPAIESPGEETSSEEAPPTLAPPQLHRVTRIPSTGTPPGPETAPVFEEDESRETALREDQGTLPPTRPQNHSAQDAPSEEIEAVEVLTEEELNDLMDELRYLKTERLKLISEGRRPGHIKVQELERKMRAIQTRLKSQPKSPASASKVKFEYVTESATETRALREIRVQRSKLERELSSLREQLATATKNELALRKKLAPLVQKHQALDAAFKPVILAPAKVISQIDGPFPFHQLMGFVTGAAIAGAIGFILAKLGTRPRTIDSLAEAETILRMPVRTLENTVRRRVA
jgi:hypothetical protein